MTLFDASAAVDATSAASSDAVVRIARAATFNGAGVFDATAGVGQLASATFGGVGRFVWEYAVNASGVFSGGSTAQADGSVRVAVKAVATGSSRFLYIAPLVIQGASYIAVAPVVDRHLRPLRAITLGPKTFRWLQPFQRGDLPVFVCDQHTPMIPYRVTYRLLQVRADGSRKLIGPRDRVPAAGDVGEFYATGQAGQGGQVGQWMIEWQLQRTSQSRPEYVEMRFQVLDAVSVGNPRDLLPRRIKFGWS